MKNHFQLILLLVFFSGILSSCSDWLDIEPQSDLVEEEFWKKREDIESVLAATYASMRDLVVPSLVWGEVRADGASFTGNKFADYARIAEVDINSSNAAIKWGAYYNTINLANTVLEYSPLIADIDKSYTEEIKNGIEAEATFIRSFCYFYLVRLWKEVPLILSPSSSDTVDFFLPKNTEKEVLRQLTNDLEEAKGKAFTDYYYQNGPVHFRGRANLFSITTLLADIYLWDENYQKCINNCNEIMAQTGYYSLLSQDDWFSMFYPENDDENMKESIFELVHEHTLNQNNKIYDDLVKISGTGGLRSNVRDFFTTGDVREAGSSPINKYIRRTKVLRRQDEEKDVNMIYYRMGDIYLMKAEALAEQNQIDEANNLIQTLSIRAGIPFTYSGSQEDLRLKILSERSKEFALEGKRWFDVLRYAKRNNFEKKQFIIDMVLTGADIQQQSVLKPRLLDTMSYYLPIPEGDILYNPNLVQNPYYDR